MSGWPGKYVIGLTGNIATGKSVVRRMLEHLGALGIDADALTHRTFAPGAPGYQPLIEEFGREILQPDGFVDRVRLGGIVFADPDKLRSLEAIVHPLVRLAVYNLVRCAPQPVIVVEAIKLLESPLRQHCDSLWVTSASPENQAQRLQQQRGMRPELAGQRIAAQPPQEIKVAAADVLIRNDGSISQVWEHVETAWRQAHPGFGGEGYAVPLEQPGFSIRCALPSEAEQVAGLIEQLDPGHRAQAPKQILAAMGSRSYWIFRQAGSVLGITGWRPDHFIARLESLYLDGASPLPPEWAAALTEGLDRAALDRQCEASLVNLPPDSKILADALQAAGYQASAVDRLPRPTWQEAAREMGLPSALYYKSFPQHDFFSAV
jgi:dephospho-CoA kinase